MAVSNGTFTLIKWLRRSAWQSKFEDTRRNVGDTSIVSLRTAKNLKKVGLVDIVGSADDVVPKAFGDECEGEDHGSISSDDPLSPYEG